MDKIISLADAFIVVHDPRIDRTKKHKLVDILIITLCATICGVEGWEEIEIFAEEREDWFKGFLELPNGIPSHDTMYRVFSRINPKELNAALIRWTEGLNQSVEGKVVAIDGKTLRGSFDTATGKAALHLISAWVEENSLVLGQVAVAGKENEITKIPELLRMLHLKGAIVTIDAIGCQKEISHVIREQCKANYVFALKKNQPSLYNEVVHFFNVAENSEYFSKDAFESLEKGHGRIEHRTCVCLDVGGELDHVSSGWSDLRTVAKIHSVRETNGKKQEQTRYFISSLACDASAVAHAVRTHWSIENSLHWRLDVTFKEDASRIRKDNAPENMAILRRIAFSLAKARTP
ncbi:ISAs1 family transposase, partial [Desulfovibrio sp. OttesenSCG-928-A18]|nr:ISAs1 family transposase [Desulfovibrio sp. OttesenSCG-928-A18]